MNFENKVVIVTGASSGIGEGVAKMFLSEGAKVVGCGMRMQTLSMSRQISPIMNRLKMSLQRLWKHLARWTNLSAVRALPSLAPWKILPMRHL